MDKKVRVSTIQKMKSEGKKIASLTAYDYTFARLFDESGMDLILVGDSCGNVCAGYETTLPVTMDEIVYHTKSVSRGVKRALLVADMPFMSFQESTESALHNAGRLVKEGNAEGVKLEGGEYICDLVEAMVEIGIPVLGHLGLTPQSIHKFSGYGIRGKSFNEAERIKKDALSLQDAGAFAIVLEKIPSALAKEITESLEIPTIGIGAGPYCDGQILVSYDMLGLFDEMQLKFVRKYANLADEIRKSVANYCNDIRSSNFPSEEESY